MKLKVEKEKKKKNMKQDNILSKLHDFKRASLYIEGAIISETWAWI